MIQMHNFSCAHLQAKGLICTVGTCLSVVLLHMSRKQSKLPFSGILTNFAYTTKSWSMLVQMPAAKLSVGFGQSAFKSNGRYLVVWEPFTANGLQLHTQQITVLLGSQFSVSSFAAHHATVNFSNASPVLSVLKSSLLLVLQSFPPSVCSSQG